MLVMTVYVMTSQVTMQGQLHMLLSFFLVLGMGDRGNSSHGSEVYGHISGV